jgi:MYXO-CTERM domain-containing protein
MFKDSRLSLALPLLVLCACQQAPAAPAEGQETQIGARRRSLALAEAGVEAGPGCGPITYKGCCSGQSLIYCSTPGTLTLKSCSPQQCGWNTTFGIYACGGTSAADPSGTLPRPCPATDAGLPDAPPPDAAVDAPVGADAQADAGCGALGYVGCCSGQLLLFCSGGQVLSQACGGGCGWNVAKGLYDCGTSGGSDPAGVFPKSCAAVLGDAGIPDLGVDLALPDASADSAGDLAGDSAWDQTVTKDGFTTSEGAPSPEASTPRDSAAKETSGLDAAGLDAVQQVDSGQLVPGGGGGCSCQSGAGGGGAPQLSMLLFALGLWLRRRGRSR